MTDEIEEKPKRGRPPKAAEKITMRVMKNFYPGEEHIEDGWPQTERGRVQKGALVDLTAEAAMDAMEAGIAVRVRD